MSDLILPSLVVAGIVVLSSLLQVESIARAVFKSMGVLIAAAFALWLVLKLNNLVDWTYFAVGACAFLLGLFTTRRK